MKTGTYARLSLLIPFLIWVISLILLLAGYFVLPELLTTSNPPTVIAVVGVLLLFYLIWIVYWFIPYLLVSLVLLLISFKGTEKVLKAAYFLSPFPMAVLIMVVVAVLTIPPLDNLLPVTRLTTHLQESLGTSVLFAIITLIWGYICVGVGFGGYRLLQHFSSSHP